MIIVRLRLNASLDVGNVRAEGISQLDFLAARVTAASFAVPREGYTPPTNVKAAS